EHTLSNLPPHTLHKSVPPCPHIPPLRPHGPVGSRPSVAVPIYRSRTRYLPTVINSQLSGPSGFGIFERVPLSPMTCVHPSQHGLVGCCVRTVSSFFFAPFSIRCSAWC